MRTVSISLADADAAAIDDALATGDYASASDVVGAALRAFLEIPQRPGPDQIDRDIAAYRSAQARGEPLLDRASARPLIDAMVRNEADG